MQAPEGDAAADAPHQQAVASIVEQRCVIPGSDACIPERDAQGNVADAGYAAVDQGSQRKSSSIKGTAPSIPARNEISKSNGLMTANSR